MKWLRASIDWVRGNFLGVGLIVGLSLLAVTELRFFDVHPHLQLFLKELAFALLIAGVFGLTIERVQRTEFVKLVTEERDALKKDVFLYAYGHNIPEEIREEIRNTILRERFYRRDLSIEWEFSELPNGGEFLSLKKEYSYFVVNNSAEDGDWPFRFIQISASDKAVVTETEFNILRIEHDGEISQWQSSELEEERPPDHPHMRRLSTMFRVRAQQTVHVYYMLTEKRKWADEDKYSARQPVVGKTTVRVRVLSPLSLDVSVACKSQPLRAAPDSSPPNKYSWHMEEGLLPHQGITIGWSPKERPERSTDGKEG
jgi:hypothetical protein